MATTERSTKPKKSNKANKKSEEPATSEDVDDEDGNTEDIDNTNNRKATHTSATTSSKSNASNKAKHTDKKSVESSGRIAEVKPNNEQNVHRALCFHLDSSINERPPGKKDINKRNTGAPKTKPRVSTRNDEGEPPPPKKLRSLPNKTAKPSTSNQSTVSLKSISNQSTVSLKSAQSSRATQSDKSGAQSIERDADIIRAYFKRADGDSLTESNWIPTHLGTENKLEIAHKKDGAPGTAYALVCSGTDWYCFMRFEPGSKQTSMSDFELVSELPLFTDCPNWSIGL